VFRRPQFVLLVIGQTVAQLGDRLHNMALIALVGTGAQVSTSGIELAKVAVVFMLPTLFGPIVGALVDRWTKRGTMLVCHILRALIVLFIPWLYRQSGHHLWPVYIVAFFVGLFGTFFNAAKMAVIPDLVVREQLLSANAALTFIGRFATVAGIVGGGVMISWAVWKRVFGWEGYEAGFYMDSASYTLSALTLIIIWILSAAHARRTPRHFSGVEAAEVVKRKLVHLIEDMRETFGLIRRHADLRFVFATVVLLGVLTASIYVIMTASVQTIMQQGTRGVGFLGGLLAGGMIVGSLLIGTVGKRWNKRHIILSSCLTMGLLMVVGGLRYSYLIFTPIAFLGGMVLAPVMVSQDTLLHETAPSAARGLIFSTRDLVLGAVFMGSSLAVGSGVPLLGALGADEPYRLALLVLGILICAAAVVGEVTVLRHRRV
jgi:MFS family permease